MTFLHKLAQRLSRMKAALLVGALVALACEIPVPTTSTSGAAAKLALSPKTLTIPMNQTADFVAVGTTASGDTTDVAVSWSATGGSIVDSSSSTGRHVGRYKSPSQPGQYKVKAQAASGALADSAVVTVSLAAVASVDVSPATAGLTAGQTTQLTATPRDAGGALLSGRVVTWSSSNGAVASVNGNGLVTAVSAGSATITATSEGRSGTSAITVTAVPVASVTVSPATASVTVGQTVQLTATPRDANGNALAGRVVTWTTSVATVATVSGSGLVTAVGAGSATITAASEGKGGTASITVTAVPVASVDVSPATAGLTAGQTTQLTATPRDAGGALLSGRVVTWSSSNGAVASVNGNGLVTAVSAGSATITATSEGRSGSATLTVTPPPPPSGAWPNEPAGLPLLTDEPFGAMTENGWNQVQRQTTNGSGLSVSNDATAPASPASVLTFKYAAGYQAGSEPGAEYFIPATPTKETYVGFWWKASNPWQFHPSGVNKITFLFTAVDNIYLMMYDDGSGPTIQVEPQLLNDVRRLAPNVTATRVTLGTWHQIEWYVKQSTTGTSADGVVKWWLDGVLQGVYTDLQMSVNPGFVEYTIAPTWGGIGGTKSETDFYWYDHYHVRGR